MQERAAVFHVRRSLASEIGRDGSLAFSPSAPRLRASGSARVLGSWPSRLRLLGVGALLGVAVALGLALGFSAGRVVSSRRQAAPPARAASSAGLGSLPVAARGPISKLIGAREPGFAVRGLRAENVDQRLRMSFGSGGVRIRRGAARLGIEPLSFGRAGTMHALGAAAPRVHGNEVDYSYGSLVESFANGPLGLEQSFEIASRPRGSGALSIRLGLTGGLSARLQHGAVALTGDGASLRYDDLVVTDARGRRLPAWFSLRGREIAIRLDARGASYPLRVDPLVQEAALRQPGTKSDGGFGGAVAISGKTIAVGDSYTFEGRTGEVYVYEEPAGGWAEASAPVVTLQSSEPQEQSSFGDAVALSANKLVVGAPEQRDAAAKNEYAGAAYVFEAPSATEWSKVKQVAKLEATTGSSLLGVSVAISGKTIVAGASGLGVGLNLGALIVFEEPVGGWKPTSDYAAKLHGPNPEEGKAGEKCPQLGDAVAVTEHGSAITVVGGAPGAYAGPPLRYNGCTVQIAGGVDVFTANVGEWSKGAEYEPTVALEAPTSEAGNSFGANVGLSEDGSTVLASAPNEMVSGVKEAGAAYIFTRPGGGWSTAPTPATITSPTSFAAANFGYSLALAANGAKIVVGQPAFKAERHNGNEFVFERPGGGWASTSIASETLTANNEEGLNLDGRAIALEGETVLTDADSAAIVFGSSVGVEIESPANGSEYTLGQSVTASYRCVPPKGETVTECNGPVASGAAIDTSSEGVHSFNVTGRDSAGQSFSRTSIYLVKPPATGPKTEPVSKEGAQQTKTKAQTEAEEAAHKALVQQELKEFAKYVLYILEHPAPLGLCFNENGFQENNSVIPVSAWISAHGTTAPTGASSAGAASVASAGKGHKPKKPKEVTVFTKTLEVKPGKVSFKIPFTSAGRALAKRDIAAHRPLKVKWTVIIRPTGLPTITKTFTTTLEPGKAKRKKHG